MLYILFFFDTAHRVIPQILVQEIKITNLRNGIFNIELSVPPTPNWLTVDKREMR